MSKEILSFIIMEAFICIVLVSQVVLWNFMELRNKKNKDDNDVNTSSPEETQPPASNDTNATPPPPRSKRKKKDVENKSTPSCRFCKQAFTSPQALGGHMNRHRGEREKEEFQKAEILLHTKGQTFAFGYPRGGAGPSYYQSEGSCAGSPYQGGGGGGTQMASGSTMGNMGAGGLQRQTVYQNPNQQQFVAAASQMNPNPNYGSTHQQTAQANVYQPQLQHGGSAYVNYNPCDNAQAGRPSQIAGGVPQTSYTPRANSGQYQVQGTGSLRDVRAYAMPHGSSTTTGVAHHHQSNPGFSSGHDLLSQAAGGANTPTTVDTIAIAALGTPAGSISANAGLCQSTAVAQFVDQSGNFLFPGGGPSPGLYSTGLRPLNPSHFHDNVQAAATETYDHGSALQDHYTSQVSYGNTSVHGTIFQVQSDMYNTAAAVGMENQYHAADLGMLNFPDSDEGEEFGNGGLDSSTIAVTESRHGGGGGGGGGSTGRSADARSHL